MSGPSFGEPVGLLPAQERALVLQYLAHDTVEDGKPCRACGKPRRCSDGQYAYHTLEAAGVDINRWVDRLTAE